MHDFIGCYKLLFPKQWFLFDDFGVTQISVNKIGWITTDGMDAGKAPKKILLLCIFVKLYHCLIKSTVNDVLWRITSTPACCEADVRIRNMKCGGVNCVQTQTDNSRTADKSRLSLSCNWGGTDVDWWFLYDSVIDISALRRIQNNGLFSLCRARIEIQAVL